MIRFLHLFILAFCLHFPLITQAKVSPKLNHEQKVSAVFNEIKTNSHALRDFLYRMPKGGELHSHLVGAVYAETFIKEAATENFCIELKTFRMLPPQMKEGKPSC